MNGAPKGCIPLGTTLGFINAFQVGSVISVSDKLGREKLSPFKSTGIFVTVGPERFYFDMSVQQFAARMVEAMNET